MFPRDSKEYRFLKKFDTPEKIQKYLDSIPFNDEEDGETCMSAKRVMEEQKAHCLEGAFFACACLIASGRKPMIVSLKVKKPDDDHVITIFKENGHYGAISKTSHPVLRYRDPVYRSIRELAMTYFHEYFLFTTGEKTLLGYTKPINLMRYGTDWITSDRDLWGIGRKIYFTPIHKVVPKENKHLIRTVPPKERKALDVLA